MAVAADLFQLVKEGPPDPILSTALAFKADTDPRKVNLGIGAYRTEEGVPYVFPVVKRAQEEMVQRETEKEYLGIDGVQELKVPTQKLIFGDDSPLVKEQRIASVQSLSGTGALRVLAEFIAHQLPSSYEKIYVSKPSWQNHRNVFMASGLDFQEYTYWSDSLRGLDIEKCVGDLSAAPSCSTVVFHACAHNPTGVDPTKPQWNVLLELVKQKNFLVVFDSAYQGYASGDIEKDAYAIRLFAEANVPMLVAQSFAKNMGLYGERVGMAHVVCPTAERAAVVLSQLKPIIRRMYSNPPRWGALIASAVLNNEANRAQWIAELKDVAGRIAGVREDLKEALIQVKAPGKWNHVTNQIGMFSYTGLTERQCERMISHWHIYMLKTGRISLAGLTKKNIAYVAAAIKDCIENA